MRDADSGDLGSNHGCVVVTRFIEAHAVDCLLNFRFLLEQAENACPLLKERLIVAGRLGRDFLTSPILHAALTMRAVTSGNRGSSCDPVFF